MNEIKEDLASFELSKLLKEKGWVQRTPMVWLSLDDYQDRRALDLRLLLTSNEYNSPELSLVVKWLELTYGIHMETFVDDDQTFGFYVTRFVPEGRSSSPIKRGFNTRAEATEKGIEYVLTNLL
jgi:hypothetical protein